MPVLAFFLPSVKPAPNIRQLAQTAAQICRALIDPSAGWRRLKLYAQAIYRSQDANAQPSFGLGKSQFITSRLGKASRPCVPADCLPSFSGLFDSFQHLFLSCGVHTRARRDGKEACALAARRAFKSSGE
jgi:hypothetical protein